MTAPLERLHGGRFRVVREVGRGGAGVVYRADDSVTGLPVALKVMSVGGGDSPDDELRMAREGQLLSTLDHPGIVKTVAWGVLADTNQPYVAMEWLEGEDLAARHQRSPLGMRAAVELAVQVAEALAAAHAAGVIHRDIKPGNIFLCATPPAEAEALDVTAKLVDFGVAAGQDVRITRTGDVVGTPAYMAPEQARGDGTVDARADLYSLGATLFELIAGRPPHVGPTAIATLARLVTTPAPHLAELRRETPRHLDDLVDRLLQTDPAARPRSAAEVAGALRDALRDAGAGHFSQAPASGEPVTSSRLGSSATRLVTSLVALRFPSPATRDQILEVVAARGADAVPLGQDAIVAHFGARRAVGSEAAAALGLGRRMAESGARVGVASGRAVVNLAAATGEVRAVGEVVDRASTLAREAEAGALLADAATAELGQGRFEFAARADGSARVGSRARGARTDHGAGAPFVGREPELAQVSAAFDRCRGDRTPVLVSISGPPGIGKTRLQRELLGRLAQQPQPPHVIVQRAEAYGRGHALGAAADVLRAIVDVPKGASVAEAEAAILDRLGPSTRDELGAHHRELLASLLANAALPERFDPRGARDAIWLAMTDLVLQVAGVDPTVIVLEDIQWADAESVAFFDHLLGRAAGHALMVLALARPSFWSEQRGRFLGRDHVRLELRPISRRAAASIARALLGDAVTDREVERIAEQAGGLPLFAEELARLRATGRDTSNAPTLEAAIQASLDSLDEEARDAVGRLSVFGMSVWDTGLAALGMRDADEVIRTLAGAEILIEQRSPRFTGAREWQYKHALVRDVAYAALGERERKELHALAAAWLAAQGEDSATVARHFDLGDHATEAAHHWAIAAQRALATNALGEALTMAERALAFAEDKPTGFARASCLEEAWSRLDPRAGDRATAIEALEENVHDAGTAVRARGARARFDDARGSGHDISERLREARDEAAELGLHDEEARSSAALATRLAFAGAFAEAEGESRRLLGLAEQRGIRGAAVDAWQTMAIIRQGRGELVAALDARRSAVAAARLAGLKEREAMLTTNLGFALTTIGARQEARTALDHGFALADAIGSQGAVRHALMNLLGWSATFGSDRQLDGQLATFRADADAAAASVWAAPDRANLGALFYRGWELLRARDGAPARAAALVRMAAQGYRATGNRDVLPVALGVWSEAERASGNLDQALRLAQEAAELLAAGAPSLLNESTVFVALHDALLAAGLPDHAREAVQHGMEPLCRRLRGLAASPYARAFLTELPQNAALLAAAEQYGLVPEAALAVLSQP